MKKYRCPHCGEKSLSIFQRLYMGYVRLGMLRVSSGNTLDGCVCNECQKVVMPLIDNSFFRLLFFPLCATYRIPATPVWLTTGLYLAGVLHWVFIPISVLYCFVFLLYIIVYSLTKPLMPYDDKSGRYDRYISLKPETHVSVNSSKYIKPYGVYGLKFDAETKDGKFKENFSDGMIPAVFYPKEKDSNTYDVHVINRVNVPDEILFDGAKFFVEDSDGVYVAKGTIEKIETE